MKCGVGRWNWEAGLCRQRHSQEVSGSPLTPSSEVDQVGLDFILKLPQCRDSRPVAPCPPLSKHPRETWKAGIVDRLLYSPLCYGSAVWLFGKSICKVKYWLTWMDCFLGCNSTIIKEKTKTQIPRLQTNPINIFLGRSIASYLKTKEHS